MAVITGTINAIDAEHQASFVSSDLRTGSLLGIDSHNGSLSGLIVSDSTYVPSSKSYLKGSLLGPYDLKLTLLDSTFVDGSRSDGTYFDSTYVVRWFSPVSLNYSIWFKAPPDGSDSTLIGTRSRTAVETSVGEFYANMQAPDRPGRYEIKWRYQKDSSSYVREIVEPFQVSTDGLTYQADYS